MLTIPKPISHAALLERFKSPPGEYAPISFYFWNGEALTRERLSWQLEQVRAQGIMGTIVSYIHQPDDRLDPGDPPVFSEDWWALFTWFIAESKRLGMRVGVQDYGIINPTLEALACEHPALRGGTLCHISARGSNGDTVRLELPADAEVVALRAYPTHGDALELETSIDLLVDGSPSSARFEWIAPAGFWTVVAVCNRASGFNPLHPESGARAIERLYAPFAARCGDELGRTLDVFFQDELDFGNRQPRWSAQVSQAFFNRKGYRLEPELAALWFDLGPRTAKLRIDYADVVTALTEEGYFRPVFEWHERHGTLFGHDNLGRGNVAESLSAYGDAFRTMRWFSAPGCDDPHLHEDRRFMGFKVNSSIAHLYGRPRVWNEGFYGSGWGVTPAQLLAALNEDFAYGATLFNPHALYYTTLGGWWEWAPPDFHFRQPYWTMTAPLWAYVTRLSMMLSSGHHRCDIAMLYPSTDLEAGFEGAPEAAASLGRRLCDTGTDFDFLDFESLERATVDGNTLRVSGEQYRALIFPAVRAVRFSSLEKALAFKRAGGLVVALGCVPVCSDRAGREDAVLNAMLEELFAESGVAADDAAVSARLDARLERDFVPDASDLCVLHRVIDGLDAYYIFNRSSTRRAVAPLFCALGRAELWDAWTGGATPALGCRVTGPYQRVPLTLEPFEGQLVVFDQSRAAEFQADSSWTTAKTLMLDGLWETEIRPLLDNRYGDFRLPAKAEGVQPALRRFRYAEAAATEDLSAPQLEDESWPEVLIDHGPRFWRLEAVAPDEDLEALERVLGALERIDPNQPVELNGLRLKWTPYAFSERLGIAGDPLLSHWLTGPHGLKGHVADEFLDVSELELNPARAGWQVYLWTTFKGGEDAHLIVKSRAACRVWIGNEAVFEQPHSLGAAHFAPWGIPDYSAPLHSLKLQPESGRQRLLVRLTLEPQQRTRALVVVKAPSPDQTRQPLESPWFAGNAAHFDHRPTDPPETAWFRLTAPPGAARLAVNVRGSLRAWLGGQPLEISQEQPAADGSRAYALRVPVPHQQAAKLALRVEPDAGCSGGAVLSSAVSVESQRGLAALGAWSDCGLESYSGGVSYSRRVNLEPLALGQRLELKLGRVVAAARVTINGREAGVVLAAPWSLEITDFVQSGENTIEILVANTVANVFADTPSPYVDGAQQDAGLFGPVQLVWLKMSQA